MTIVGLAYRVVAVYYRFESKRLAETWIGVHVLSFFAWWVLLRTTVIKMSLVVRCGHHFLKLFIGKYVLGEFCLLLSRDCYLQIYLS